MALTQIDFDEEEEEIINRVCKEQDLNKPKAVKKIVKGYGGFLIHGNTR